MSKKNKVVYSDIQPNAKEAGVWVNTTDGNVMVEKDGKWVDDGGSGSGSEDESIVYLKVALDGFDPGLRNKLLSCSCAIVYNNFDNSGHVSPSSTIMMNTDSWTESVTLAIAIDLNAEMVDFDTAGNATRYTVKDRLIELGVFDIVNDIPKLTKEQFYNFDF